jgi:DNA-binding HxlR family transcriptional regulator
MGVEMLGERWTLLIVRELIAGAHGFNEIHRGLPGISRTLLSQRLRHLVRVGVVRKMTEGYRLTEAGEELRQVVGLLGSWTVRWAFPRPTPVQADPQLLLWRMRGGIVHDELPEGRTTIRFTLTDAEVTNAWLVVDRGQATLCLRDPLFEVDVYASGSTLAWYEVWYGHRTLETAQSSGEVRLEGRRPLVRRFPKWFSRSRFADEVAQYGTSHDECDTG